MGWVLMTANFLLSGDTALYGISSPLAPSKLGDALFKQYVGWLPQSTLSWAHLQAVRQRPNRRAIGRDGRHAQGPVSSAQTAPRLSRTPPSDRHPNVRARMVGIRIGAIELLQSFYRAISRQGRFPNRVVRRLRRRGVQRATNALTKLRPRTPRCAGARFCADCVVAGKGP